MRSFSVFLLGAVASLGSARNQTAPADGPAAKPVATIDFTRQVRPILSDNCFTCHGPDEKQRKARFRLDLKEAALGKLRDGSRAIVPGKPDDSVLLQRLEAKEPSERMPPPHANKKVTPEQIGLIRQWIQEGAPFAEHWAFVPPKRPALPPVKNKAWPRNPIDHFILARLEKEGLTPLPEADPVTLIRRLTLDLTGLPPTPAEVDAFLADKSPDAYEKLVDRLFASPHYGERLALDWLDAARFADTHGYHIDAGRDMTRWRDYVIDSFQKDLPFDRFTIEQLAGDLLPNATVRQKVASGFNRNHMINFEGGAIPQEYHTAYIVDRVNTTTTVWLGLTFACAQCHDHKYDPISHKEYYQLFAFFNNVPESGLDGSKGNAAPMIPAPTAAQARELARIDADLISLEKNLSAGDPKLDAAQSAWEKTALDGKVVVWHPLQPSALNARGGAKLTVQPDKAILVTGANPPTDSYTITAPSALKTITALRLEALPHDSFNGKGPGRSINGNIVLTNIEIAAKQKAAFKTAVADFSQKDYPIANAIDANPQTGWAIHPEVGKPLAATFVLNAPLTVDGGVAITLDFNSQSGQHQLGHFRLSVTDAEQPLGKQSIPDNIVAALKMPADQRTAAQKSALRTFYRTQVVAGPTGQQIAKLRQSRSEIEKQMQSTMVMQEMPAPRETFILKRGEYDKKLDKVTAATPSFLPPLAKDAPSTRLGLARWLVDPKHPLTSRVTVNRYWQMFMGTGLVKTAEDFGSQGELPSHPELLDWLAAEFTDPSFSPGSQNRPGAWSVRHLVRLIVTSAAYRQSSRITPALVARDPENRLLARGPRFRLQAEFIRDQALAASGLLNREIGGRSVSPYQPLGLWEELAIRGDSKNWSAQFFVQGKGPDLYRRSMYTFWKRTSPPPQMMTFDAPDREVCTVRRSRTNTPLQALVLMNDPTYVEAARKLAERVLKEKETTSDRLTHAFRLVTARTPRDAELAILQATLTKNLDRYRKNEKAAHALLAVGESPRDERFSVSELAGWTMTMSVILNLDETVTRN